MAKLRPEDIRVLDVLLQLHVDDRDAGAAGRIGLLLAHFLELEDVGFQGLGDLLFHLFRGGTGIHGRDDASPDGDGGILSARHAHQGVKPHRHRHDEKNGGDGWVAQEGFDGFIHGYLLPFTGSALMPLRREFWPATTTNSFPVRPERTWMLRPYTAPTSTRLE